MTVGATTPLIQYWHEERLPGHAAETLGSFRKHNPRMEQLVFDESSAEELIEARYGPREAAAFRACAVPAMQADYFRYCAVHALGGLYADATFHCRSGLEWLLDGPGEGVLFGRQDPVPSWLTAVYNWRYPVGPYRAVTNSMFGFRAHGHPLLELAIEASTANIENRVANGPVGVWVTAGPGVFTSLYLLHELGSIDAFLEYSVDSVIEPSAPLLCEVVGDYGRLAGAWDGIAIRPLAEREALGAKSKDRPMGNSWIRVKGSIFR